MITRKGGGAKSSTEYGGKHAPHPFLDFFFLLQPIPPTNLPAHPTHLFQSNFFEPHRLVAFPSFFLGQGRLVTSAATAATAAVNSHRNVVLV